MKDLEGQVALVTGGSRGIGRAVSLTLAAKGCHVFVNPSSNPSLADETARLCQELGGKADVVGFDVSDSDTVSKEIDQIKESVGRLDILVNNAGISKDGLILRLKDDDWERTLSVNLNGAFYCARAASKIMTKARSGRIINISSVTAEMGNPGQVPYVSSKAGLIGLTKSLAKELGSRSITVNAITPGFISTDMTDKIPEKTQEEYKKGIPLGRFGEPSEVAELVGFLAGPKAGYITGQVIGINGGMYM
ncbi:MAG: 3-oxoacyl-[acyl-carrier-protein] reductase [Bdellovibrionales bacterium]|nr:3-oxoacyl-[acyl-carrier-protein] reductase [Bdellovibrionales bacterium]